MLYTGSKLATCQPTTSYRPEPETELAHILHLGLLSMPKPGNDGAYPIAAERSMASIKVNLSPVSLDMLASHRSA